jgi:hypothetical protein
VAEGKDLDSQLVRVPKKARAARTRERKRFSTAGQPGPVAPRPFRFGDPRVLVLLGALVIFRLLPRGFSNRDLRLHVAPLLGLGAAFMTQG